MNLEEKKLLKQFCKENGLPFQYGLSVGLNKSLAFRRFQFDKVQGDFKKALSQTLDQAIKSVCKAFGKQKRKRK